jgi:hypothetical protein
VRIPNFLCQVLAMWALHIEDQQNEGGVHQRHEVCRDAWEREHHCLLDFIFYKVTKFQYFDWSLAAACLIYQVQ